MEKFDICRSKEFYLAWPTLIKQNNGDLLCIFTSCNHHIDRDNSCLMFVRSSDRGRTWSKAEPFTELTQKESYYNNARVRRMGDSIVVVCDKIQQNEKAEVPAEVYLWVSEDDGMTFSPPIKTAGCGIVPDIKQLSNGNWLLTAHRTVPEHEKIVQFAWISEDRGQTWSEEIAVGKDAAYNLCEASVLECEDHTLIAFMRENSHKGYDCFKSFSKDGGYTWEGLCNAPLPGCHRPTVGYLKDGRVLLTYRFFPGEVSRGMQTYLALTTEEDMKESARWNQKVRLMPLDYDRNTKQQDCGYTDWVQYEDGEIYIVNYIKDDWDKGQIRGYSLNLTDILL